MKKHLLILFFTVSMVWASSLSTPIIGVSADNHESVAQQHTTTEGITVVENTDHDSANSSEHEGEEHSGHDMTIPLTFLWIAIIVFAAKISGLIEKIGQPPVLGELLIGVILGNLALIGISIFEPMKTVIFPVLLN